jgi:hypothetical protein
MIDPLSANPTAGEVVDKVNEIISEGTGGGGAVTSVNGQTGDVVLTVPVTSVNGQTGAVTVSVPVTSVNGLIGAVNVPKPPSLLGVTYPGYFTYHGFTNRKNTKSPSYSFSPAFNQGGSDATIKISPDGNWGIFRANRYTSNSSFVSNMFFKNLFTGQTSVIDTINGISRFSAVASMDGTTIYNAVSQGGSVIAYSLNATGTADASGSFSTRYSNTANREILRSSDTSLYQGKPTYLWAGYSPTSPSNILIKATVADFSTTQVTISSLTDVRNFSVSPYSQQIFAIAADGSYWFGTSDGVTPISLPASITGTVLGAVFQKPNIGHTRINEYLMAVRWDDAGTKKLSIVTFQNNYGGSQSLDSTTHYTVDVGDIMLKDGFSPCGNYVMGEYGIVDINTGNIVSSTSNPEYWIG